MARVVWPYRPQTKIYAVAEHQHKGKALVQTLTRNGWRKTARLRSTGKPAPRFALIDNNTHGRGGIGERPSLAMYREFGVPIILYPHAARPPLWWDIFGAYPFAACQLVPSAGHERVLRKMGFKSPVEVIGWYYSAVNSFRPRPRATRVLFAPTHPNANGWLNATDMELNAEAFRLLLDLVPGIELRVRHVHTLDANGLWEVPYIDYVRGSTRSGSLVDADWADVVVSTQTFAFMCIARGVPTVMYGEDLDPRFGNSLESFTTVSRWSRYKDDVMYPVDLFNARKDPLSLLQTTARGFTDAQAEWKSRMIGSPYSPQKFLRALSTYGLEVE